MIINKIVTSISNRDEIVDPSALKLHFDGDVKIKTLIGGLISIFIEAFVIYTAVSKSIHMSSSSDPQITQIEQAL